MKSLWNSAAGLLVVTGALLGLTLPFGKLAGEAGVPPAVWALLVSAGTGLVLFTALLANGAGLRLDAHRLRYFGIVAAISYALPNLLMFSAMPHLGAGYTGIMFTLTPVITLLLSLVLGVRRPSALGVAGIAVGFAGAVLVASTRGEAGAPAALSWVLVGLVIPVSLSAGNVYRTWDWPKEAGPIELAAGSNLAAAAMLALFVASSGNAGAIGGLSGLKLLSAAQVASAAGMFAFFFRLQAVGGPVYLSQIGYVAAAIGLLSGTLFLGERYEAATWLGALIIGAGVVLTTRAQSGGR
jgi:drug/metabolite transporter (DMT)-like permease